MSRVECGFCVDRKPFSPDYDEVLYQEIIDRVAPVGRDVDMIRFLLEKGMDSVSMQSLLENQLVTLVGEHVARKPYTELHGLVDAEQGKINFSGVDMLETCQNAVSDESSTFLERAELTMWQKIYEKMLAGESNTAVWISPAREGSNYGFVVLLNRNGALVEETIFLYDDEFGNLDPSNDILNKVNQICSGDQVPVNYDSAEQFIENPFFVNSSGQEDLKNHVMELLGISSSNVQMSKQFDNELLSQGRRFLDEYAALVMEMSRLGEGSLHSEYYLDLYRQAELNRDALVGLGRRIKNSFQGYFADMSFMIDQDGHTKDSLTHLIESDDLYGLAYLGRSSQFEHGSSCAFGGGGAFGGIGYPGGEFNSNVRQGLVFGMTPISAIRFATESKKVKQLSLADWRKIMSYCKDKRLSAECGSCPYCKTRGYYKVSDNKLVCSNISCRRCA